MIDLKSYLADSKRADLDRIIESAKRLLSESIGHYTDHTIKHSERIITILNCLLVKLMEPNPTNDPYDLQPLNEHEIFILLAACYLHDVGMHYKKETENLEEIREKHHIYSYNMIVDSVKDPQHNYNFNIPEEYVDSIALVSKGHRKIDLASRTYTVYIDGINIEIRLRFLTALLKLADELDIVYERVDIQKLKISNVNSYSMMHWFKHYYVGGIGINNGNIQIHFRFPQERYEEYKKVVPQVVFKDIDGKVSELRDHLWSYDVFINLSRNLNNHKCHKRSIEVMPDEVFREMEKYIS